MAKTKPIGVRFDETLLGKLKEMGYPTPQRALSFLEVFWAKNIAKIVEINNQLENKERIEEERNPTSLSFLQILELAKSGSAGGEVEAAMRLNGRLTSGQQDVIRRKIKSN